MRRVAFTMIELIFVIVIMGILSKFGVEFLAQAYNNFIYSSINNSLQARGEAAVETIAARLQYRIKDSIIARDPIANTFEGLSGSTLADDATVLEWVGMDIDGFRGDGAGTLPLWSGIIDLDASIVPTTLTSPRTNINTLNAHVNIISPSNASFVNGAIYFIGSDSDVQNGYGWNGALVTHIGSTMQRINNGGGANQFTSPFVNFTGVDIYEYYQYSWTAYAIVHNTVTDELWLHYDYRPWLGENYLNDGVPVLIMGDVDTFRFTAIGSIVKIQVCVNSDVMEDYSLCKEKTIY